MRQLNNNIIMGHPQSISTLILNLEDLRAQQNPHFARDSAQSSSVFYITQTESSKQCLTIDNRIYYLLTTTVHCEISMSVSNCIIFAGMCSTTVHKYYNQRSSAHVHNCDTYARQSCTLIIQPAHGILYHVYVVVHALKLMPHC